VEDTRTKIFNNPDIKIPIEETPLKERTKRLLINSRKITDVSELCQYTKWQILSWRGVGDVTLNDIIFCMRSYGLMLKDDLE
jgi:DNA-directed RNA polymerase alpha subunit